jgi:uncharacterized membrane protein
MKPVLLAGETFHVTSFASKGLEVGASARYSNGATRYIQTLAATASMSSRSAASGARPSFRGRCETLSTYSAVIHFGRRRAVAALHARNRIGQRSVNRLELLRQWVEQGGALMMAGGYTCFQGMDGSAMFHGTAVEECLPVEIHPGPDGLEAPEGLDPVVIDAGHPVMQGLTSALPFVLGMNRVIARP